MKKKDKKRKKRRVKKKYIYTTLEEASWDFTKFNFVFLTLFFVACLMQSFCGLLENPKPQGKIDCALLAAALFYYNSY